MVDPCSSPGSFNYNMSEIRDSLIKTSYRTGELLEKDFDNLTNFGYFDDEAGKFKFKYCKTCGGPLLGHIDDVCLKDTRKKKDVKLNDAEIEYIEKWFKGIDQFNENVSKIDTRIRFCNVCGND